VAVQSLSTSQVHPGHDASYAIWVWSTNGTSRAVSVNVGIQAVRHVSDPHFTVCRTSHGTTCGIGELPAGQADELEASAPVGAHATGGEVVDLTASASAANATSYSASGSISVVTARHSASPSPTVTPQPEPTVTITLPPVPEPEGTGTVNPVGGLFPTVSPSASRSGHVSFPAAGGRSGHGHQRTRVRATADIVPLDPRLIGGQLAGLAVLAGAIAIAIARLSLRKPKTQSGPAEASKAEPPSKDK
jgi:hypothetical protein